MPVQAAPLIGMLNTTAARSASSAIALEVSIPSARHPTFATVGYTTGAGSDTSPANNSGTQSSKAMMALMSVHPHLQDEMRASRGRNRIDFEADDVSGRDRSCPARERCVLSFRGRRYRWLRSRRDRVSHSRRIVRVGVFPNVEHDRTALVKESSSLNDRCVERDLNEALHSRGDGRTGAIDRNPDRAGREVRPGLKRVSS